MADTLTSRLTQTQWQVVDTEVWIEDDDSILQVPRVYSCTERLAVPGGWLYRTIINNNVATVALAFVPD